MTSYDGLTFFQVLWAFFTRLPDMLMGSSLATDEIQFLVLNFLAVATSLVGTLSVLRRYTMMANALSHTLLIGIVIVFLFGFHPGEMTDAPMTTSQLAIAALVGAGLTAWTVHLFTASNKMKEDAGIGASFTFLFALGILLLSYISRNAHIGVELLIGNADALVEEDVMPALISALLALFVFTLFSRGWKVSCFDPIFANLSGFSHKQYGAALLLIQAFCVVVAFRSVGVVMVLGLLCLPPLIARLFCSSFKSMAITSAIVAVVGSTCAIALSRHLVTVYSFALSTGALVVVLLAIIFALSCCYKKIA